MDGRYGEGTGPIFYRDLQCIGTEDNVHNCSSETGETCYHGLDVGLICSGCPRLDQQHYGYLEHVNITSEGDVYIGNCGNETSTFQFLYTCYLNGTWEEDGTNCGPLDIKGVRLVDGVSLYDGFVEVLVGEVWGPVCVDGYINSQYFYSSTGGVFCRMLGLRQV
ncbi:hypothetical protein DPMN_045136 [Dreissena polymorpha]|uniref:SRCR domain-containing protein n=1 Tax=Dreissena polymorpha TaxID=45954 RepID=A0A9D4HZL4_DREPO|nr:hypothetical protein DPMN_045136 [Dreissena polymorpha]